MTPEERVKDLINTHCLSQAKVARSMGISANQLSLLVNGKRNLSAFELSKFCDAIHISANEFFAGMN